MSDIRRADPARTFHADDAEVVGYLYPRPIAAGVAVAFGSRPFRMSVFGFQRRLHGIRPDPVKA